MNIIFFDWWDNLFFLNIFFGENGQFLRTNGKSRYPFQCQALQNWSLSGVERKPFLFGIPLLSGLF